MSRLERLISETTRLCAMEDELVAKLEATRAAIRKNIMDEWQERTRLRLDGPSGDPESG